MTLCRPVQGHGCIEMGVTIMSATSTRSLTSCALQFTKVMLTVY